MTDIDLMRRSAKAAGIDLDVWTYVGDSGVKALALYVRGTRIEFNPLAFDRDAFQVMLGAGLDVQATKGYIAVRVPGLDVRNHYDGDRATAARRAIVEVAAVLA